MPSLHHYAAVFIAAGLTVATVSAAEEPVTSQVPAADLKELNDPTILTRRIFLETEWNKFRDGTHIVEETLGGLWAWRVSDYQDWAVRIKLPYKMRFDSDTPGVNNLGGLGDIKIATGTAFRVSKTFRIGLGVDLAMPTGRNNLSDDFWRMQEFIAFGWDITPWLTFSPSLEYNQSFEEESGIAPAHFVETFVPFTFILPHKWAFSLGYENKVDIEDHNYVTNRGKIQISKELENVPLAFSLSAKRDFDAGEKEFQVNFVMTYFFR
jgi:hypothetical protein